MGDGEARQSPYAEALTLLDRRNLAKALDVLHWAGRDLDPLAYDEAWAEVEFEREDYGAAAGLAQRTLRAGRETARLHEIAAGSLWLLGTREEARRHAERAGEETPRNLFLKARIAFDDADWADAERLATKALALAPDWADPEALRLAARAFGGEREAKVALRLLWERTRSHYALYLLLLDGLRRRDPSVADALFLDAQAAGVLDSAILAQVMWVRAQRRDWDGVIAAFEAAPQEERNTTDALRMRSLAATGKHEHAEAVSYLERSLELSPMAQRTEDALFDAYVRTRQWWRAIQLVKTQSKARKAAGRDEESLTDML